MAGGPVSVSVVERAPGGASDAAVGDMLLGCDGVPVERMMQDAVLRRWLNPHGPQPLTMMSSRLLLAGSEDRRDRPASVMTKRSIAAWVDALP